MHSKGWIIFRQKLVETICIKCSLMIDIDISLEVEGLCANMLTVYCEVWVFAQMFELNRTSPKLFVQTSSVAQLVATSMVVFDETLRQTNNYNCDRRSFCAYLLTILTTTELKFAPIIKPCMGKVCTNKFSYTIVWS